jgi:hypothetical protein
MKHGWTRFVVENSFVSMGTDKINGREAALQLVDSY